MMKSLLGIIIKSVIGLALLLGLGFLALSYFANPERLKPYAINFVHDKYQRTLSMGDIHWRVFPKLGLSINDVSLSDNPQFGNATFAAMKTVSVFVDTMSLLRGHVDVKTVELVDVKADLKTDPKGVNSWDDLAQAAPASAPVDVKSEAPVASKEKGSGLSISDLSFNVEKIEIKNGEFSYADAQSGSTYKISEMSFEGENIGVDKAFPVALKFVLSSTAPTVAATVSAKASLTVAMKNGAFDPNGVTLDGVVDMPSLNMQGIKITSLKAPVTYSAGILKLNGMSAAFYGGSLGGGANIDTHAVPMRVAIDYDLKGVQMGPMLKDLKGQDNFTGTLNMKGNLSFKSSPVKKQMMQSLDGNAKVNLHKGVLKGVDLAYFYALGSNLLDPKHPVPQRNNSGQTDFETTQATVVINKGMLTNKDLVLMNSGIYGSGSGTVNFVSDQIDYRFRIQGVQQGANGIEPVGNVIPLQITGSTENPNISLDMSIVKEKIVDTVKQQVGQQIFKALGR